MQVGLIVDYNVGDEVTFNGTKPHWFIRSSRLGNPWEKIKKGAKLIIIKKDTSSVEPSYICRSETNPKIDLYFYKEQFFKIYEPKLKRKKRKD